MGGVCETQTKSPEPGIPDLSLLTSAKTFCKCLGHSGLICSFLIIQEEGSYFT